MSDAPFRVLIVEDSITVVAAITKHLAAAISRVTICQADTEDAGLALLNELPQFDLVVVDLQLAQGTGFGVIRKAEGLREPPGVIVFTNHAVPALKVAAFEAGADYFLDKANGIAPLVTIARERRNDESLRH